MSRLVEQCFTASSLSQYYEAK